MEKLQGIICYMLKFLVDFSWKARKRDKMTAPGDIGTMGTKYT